MSGSAVFVSTEQSYRGEAASRVVAAQRARIAEDSGILQPGTVTGRIISLEAKSCGPWLLGIDLGHIPMMKTVYEKTAETEILTETDFRVDANTGIACELPAWKILEVLDAEELVKERNRSRWEIRGNVNAIPG